VGLSASDTISVDKSNAKKTISSSKSKNEFALKLELIGKSFITKTGARKSILNNFSLDIEMGKMYGIVGASGSGKSTILQIASLLNPPTSGKILLNSSIYNKYNSINVDMLSDSAAQFNDENNYIEISSLGDSAQSIIRNRVFGFIYQFHYLMSDFTVMENVLMPRFMGDISSKSANELLKSFNIFDKKDSMPYALSGGERQRVAIARAVVNNPDILFADEPTGNLDEKNENIVYEFLRERVEKYGMACVIATHSKNLAKKMDKIIELP
jgi:lipoprotein-releasing system ATP-binding protein